MEVLDCVTDKNLDIKMKIKDKSTLPHKIDACDKKNEDVLKYDVNSIDHTTGCPHCITTFDQLSLDNRR